MGETAILGVDGETKLDETGLDKTRIGKTGLGETGLVVLSVQVDLAALRARAVYLEAMEGVPDNATRTIERLDELLDPERVEDATMLRSWKERYANEITTRTKSRWFKRLFGTRRTA